MTATIVVAVAENGVIGRENDMPWHLPDDLKRFKRLTLGKTLLMGRRTFDSIGRPLPGRRTVVLTRDENWRHEGVEVLHSLDAARALLRDPDQDVVLAGGGELYAALLPEVDRLEITHIDSRVAGDTFFPEIDPAQWRAIEREDRYGFSWVSYVRRSPEGETDLAVLLGDLRPTADPTDLVFVSLPPGTPVPADVVPLATVLEDEGLTVLVAQTDADRHGWPYGMVQRRITLGVSSSLAAVGLTAAVARALAEAGIPANMLAGVHHDHVHIPVGQVDRALTALADLASSS